MKALYRKIAQIMKNRILRKRLRRYISVIAVIVVFVTTYATVLPAITLEKTASCGIEEHQHSDDCYEERLSCGQEESEGHHHDESCYTVTKELVCQDKEHQHSEEDGCYDEEGNLICKSSEHVHDDSCYEEVETLTCDQEESEGHHHTDACYEKVLVCGKEAHTHSVVCYDTDEVIAEENTEDTSADTTPENAGADNSAASEAELTTEEAQPENYVPELDPVELETVLGRHTGFYYYHPEEGEELPESSTEITDWQELKDDTVLASGDLVRVYLPYTIPAGNLNATNLIAQYRLPENIHLTDKQIKAINKNKNGFYNDIKDSDEDADKYLGAEAIEGDRRPDEELNDDAQEYISAIVRVKESSHGRQDLIFTFVPYTIEKNQTVYDADKNPVSTGEKITGWFACDFTMEQIDWVEEEESLDASEEASEQTAQDSTADEKNSEGSVSNKIVKTIEKTAEVVFVEDDSEKGIEEISSVLKLEEQIEDTEAENSAAEADTFKDGTLTADGDGYTITMDYTVDAKIPENAKLCVREITAETDKDTYENCLAQAKQHMADSGNAKPAVDTYASRFFDIEILTDEGKIEPAAPVNVNIQILDAPVVTSEEEKQPEPTILHFGENGVEQIDASTNEGAADIQNADADSADGKDANTDQTGYSDTASADQGAAQIRFEAESFSVYGVVYSITKTVITAKGETYEITVSYDENANIPDGAELAVREIKEDSDDYLQVLGGAWSRINEKYLEREQKNNNGEEVEPLDDPLYVKNILQACFFDISFMYKGKEIEPAAPVNVDIRLINGLNTAEDATATVLHFKKDSTESAKKEDNKKHKKADENAADSGSIVRTDSIETIENVETKETKDKITQFRFQQDSFSIDGFLTSVEANRTLKTPVKLTANRASGENTPPKAKKWKTENGDGTHKIHLSVTGSSETSDEVKKTNVIIIMDESSSMDYGKYYYVGDSNQGIPDFEPEYNVSFYPSNTSVSLFASNPALTYQNGKFYTNGWYGLEAYTGPVYYFKNRLDHEKEALSAMFHNLLEFNDPEDPKLSDLMEIYLIGFNQGAWPQGNQGWTKSEEALNDALYGIQLHDYTQWWDALNLAKQVAQNKRQEQPDEDVHVIFLTDGTPLKPLANVNWNECKTSVTGLMGLGEYIHLYNVYTYGSLQEAAEGRMNPLVGQTPDTSYLKRLTNVAYGNGDTTSNTEALQRYFFDADTQDAMISMLGDIFTRITKSLAYGKAKITDEMATDVIGTTLVEGKADGFTYVVKSNNGNELYSVTATGNTDNPTVTFTIGAQTSTGYKRTETIDGRQYTYYSNYETTPTTSGGTPEYKMALASIDSDGKVTWDLTGIGPLEDEYIYECNFDVWPNQDAFDTLAALNNGTTTWDVSTQIPVTDDDNNTLYYMNGVPEFPHIVKYEDGTYRALSNKSQKLDYAIVNTTTTGGVTETTYEDQEPIDLEYPEPMSLEKEKIKVKKDWEDDLSPAELNDLLTEKLKADGTVDYSVKLRLWQDKDTADRKEVTTETDTDGFNIIPTVTVEGRKVTSSVWPEKEAYIAPGVMVISTPEKEKIYYDTTKYPRYSLNGITYIQLETGHQYELTEDNTDLHFELDTEPFHPMMINDELYAVKFKNGEMTEATKMANTPTLTAKNVLKSGLNIYKKVVKDDAGQTETQSDQVFSFKIKLTKDSATGNPVYTTSDQFDTNGDTKDGSLGFRVNTSTDIPKDASNVAEDKSSFVWNGLTFTQTLGDNGTRTGYNARGPIENTGEITLKIRSCDNIRVVNIPSGTYYQVQEIDVPEGFTNLSNLTTGDAGKVVGNHKYDAYFYNKQNTGSLKIKKQVTINGFAPDDAANVSTDDKNKADGTYTFTVAGKADTPIAGKTYTVTIKITNGVPESATLDGSTVTLVDGAVVIPDMIPGEYTVTESANDNTICTSVVCSDNTAVTDVSERTCTVTVGAGETGQTAKLVTYTNNHADSGTDIAHISVRKTFKGLTATQLPENFKINVTVNITEGGSTTQKTFELTNSATQPSGITFNATNGDDTVWDWKISISGLKTDAKVSIAEVNYVKPGFDVTSTINGQTGTSENNVTVSPDTIIQGVINNVYTPNKKKIFPLKDQSQTATIFIARLTSDQTALVISKNKLSLSERAKIESELTSMGNAGDWTHGGNAVLYYSFADAADNKIHVKGAEITYSDTNGGQIEFKEKCQWTMVSETTITYKPGRPADFNFVNEYVQKKVDLDVIKVDKDNVAKKLPGAEFTLKQLDPDQTGARYLTGGVVMVSAPTDANGKTSFTQLTTGYYEIDETKTPEGYVKTEDSKFYIKVYDGVITFIQYDKDKKPTEWADAANTTNITFELAKAADSQAGTAAQNATATVKNEPGAELPSTGGPGTRIFTILGTMLITFGAAMLLFRRQTR